jgi:AraC-like DNA-binding protein
MRDTIIATGLDQQDRAEIERTGFHVLIKTARSLAEVGLEVQRAPAAAVILAIDGLERHAVDAALGDLQERGTGIPVIIRLSLTRTNAAWLIYSAAASVRYRVSLRGFDNLGDDVSREIAERCRGGAFARIAALLGDVPSPVLNIVVGSAAIGHHRTTVPTLARACGMSPRTLEWRLSRNGVASGARLLRVMLTLHTVWCIEMMGWTVKRTSVGAGFATRSGLSNFLQRQTGHSPSEFIAFGGFEELARGLPRQLARD